MRRLSLVVPVIITGIALYFALGFGSDAARILTSPVYGLDNPAFARIVRDVGMIAGLGPDGLMLLALFLGTLKLAVAVICAIHILERLASLRGFKIDHEFLDAGMLLAVLLAFIASLPALIEASPILIAPHRPIFWLAGLAATLGMLEGMAQPQKTTRTAAVEGERAIANAVLPPRRLGASAARWNDLRKLAVRQGR
ncbi:MAG: hypothetical protein HXY30_03765 [Pseudorhodoplanes sp.]|nr:hypothetical protein [Pseudorhodoplanes sp.]